jgi:hypothetical protein
LSKWGLRAACERKRHSHIGSPSQTLGQQTGFTRPPQDEDMGHHGRR